MSDPVSLKPPATLVRFVTRAPDSTTESCEHLILITPHHLRYVGYKIVQAEEAMYAGPVHFAFASVDDLFPYDFDVSRAKELFADADDLGPAITHAVLQDLLDTLSRHLDPSYNEDVMRALFRGIEGRLRKRPLDSQDLASAVAEWVLEHKDDIEGRLEDPGAIHALVHKARLTLLDLVGQT